MFQNRHVVRRGCFNKYKDDLVSEDRVAIRCPDNQKLWLERLCQRGAETGDQKIKMDIFKVKKAHWCFCQCALRFELQSAVISGSNGAKYQ
ncbi:MAG: hypothetical protein COB16_04370 [Rhodobacteraceae bacterium]|nr:MAG: hypothetical protein COB16_04370 [Paracoccaceae bacterium]